MSAIAAALNAFSATLHTLNVLEEWINARKQAGEMTPEEEAEWDRKRATRMAGPHWRKSTEPTPDPSI